ncbi:copper chaperone [Labedella populi]|uniref:Copper chaperone n=1 Tax=Labedella populi TaxID=2498850 RepID=A0A444QF53_9MICO|nr:heavy-metal-associated domain-containing protein [Labedella populi]RWZ68165.1 copper chaperone [Labedella populi]
MSSTHEPASPVHEQYLVSGMTCDHCVRAVTEEISAIDGVESVGVDLHEGGVSRVDVVSTRPLAATDVEAAILEAGYSLASA